MMVYMINQNIIGNPFRFSQFCLQEPLREWILEFSSNLWPWLKSLIAACKNLYYLSNDTLQGKMHLSQKCFVLYPKITCPFVKNINCVLIKQIVQGTQKWHWNFREVKHCSFQVTCKKNTVNIDTLISLSQEPQVLLRQ